MPRRLGFASLAVVAAVVVSACSSSGSSPSPTAAPSSAAPATAPPTAASSAPPSESGAAGSAITVFAASSLTAAFKDIAAAYEATTPGAKVTLSFDSSATLETQIEQGAPADVFASADTTNPGKLVKANLAAGAPINFAGNVLTIIVPVTGTPVVTKPEQIGQTGTKVVAAGDAVPITKYATQLVANLAKQPGYPANFVGQYNKNVVSKEDNVKGIVTKIELGEGDAGIVYVTDATASTKVSQVTVPPDANVPATYAQVAVKASRNLVGANSFMGFVTSPAGQAILAKYGFLPPS
jgi:molybdate transport system substrate-binding protein